MANPEPLLDLDTAFERDFILIDDAKFEIYSPEELSVMQSHRFGRWGTRIKQLQSEDGADAEAELQTTVDRAARAAFVEIDDATFAKLSGQQKQAVVEVFTALLLRNAIGVAGAMHKAAGTTNPIESQPTTASSSPGLFASMAAALSSGWKTRRSVSSART